MSTDSDLRCIRSEQPPQRVSRCNRTARTAEFVDSLQVPDGRDRVWLSATCWDRPSAVAIVWWLVARDAAGAPRLLRQLKLSHGCRHVAVLPPGTVSVEVGVHRIPPGFAYQVWLQD